MKQTAKSSWKNRGDLQWKDTFSLTNAQNTPKPKNRRQQPTPIPVPTSHLHYDQWLHRKCTNELQPIRDLDKTASKVNKTASQRRKSKLWRINSVRKSKHQKSTPKEGKWNSHSNKKDHTRPWKIANFRTQGQVERIAHSNAYKEKIIKDHDQYLQEVWDTFKRQNSIHDKIKLYLEINLTKNVKDLYKKTL